MPDDTTSTAEELDDCVSGGAGLDAVEEPVIETEAAGEPQVEVTVTEDGPEELTPAEEEQPEAETLTFFDASMDGQPKRFVVVEPGTEDAAAVATERYLRSLGINSSPNAAEVGPVDVSEIPDGADLVYVQDGELVTAQIDDQLSRELRGEA